MKDEDRVNHNEKDNGTTRKEDKFREAQNQSSSVHISCKILEEYSFYDVKSNTKLTTKPLDSLDEKTRWYKVIIDQDIPPNTVIKLSYLCSNYEWSKGEKWTTGTVNSKNNLILDCVGRYLKLKVELSSLDRQKSPRFNKMIVYFSVPTYMRYLPEIYQENEQSKIFLERFLSIFQTLFEETENKIYSFTKNLDVRTTPEEFLPWLSSWLSLSFSEGWSSDNIRSFLEKAPEIFKKRGTREGLEEALSIYLQNTIRDNLDLEGQSRPHLQQDTDENNMRDTSSIMGKDFSKRLDKGKNYFFILDGKDELSELSNKLNNPTIKDLVENISPDVLPYCFYVFLNPLLIDRIKAEAIERIIENEKPAHTVGIVRFLQVGAFKEAVVILIQIRLRGIEINSF